MILSWIFLLQLFTSNLSNVFGFLWLSCKTVAISFHIDQFLYSFSSAHWSNDLGISDNTGVNEEAQGFLGLSVNMGRMRFSSSFSLGRQKLFNPSASYSHLWNGCSSTPHRAAVRINESLLWGTCLTQRDSYDQVCPKATGEHPQSRWWVSEKPHSGTPGDRMTSGDPEALGGSANRSGSDSECLVSTGDLQQDCPRPGMDKRPLKGWCLGIEHEPLLRSRLMERKKNGWKSSMGSLRSGY